MLSPGERSRPTVLDILAEKILRRVPDGPPPSAQSVVCYASGDVDEVTEPAGEVIRYTYDGLGRMVTGTEPGVTNRVTGAVHTAPSSPRTTPPADRPPRPRRAGSRSPTPTTTSGC
ncbi:RHS repeat domain-containing protein [Polymorphospora rubra]|uniref:RHS repeat domain-containing protein n=1 Tax=Polymorphospora rubra TaxID=338584 RepID=UPI001BB41E12|nr:RHS repeat domain-containing protein [Polymorphospora rubra]